MEHRFRATIERSGSIDAAYVVVPVDIRKVYGKGRLKVEATFDGEHYSGSVVNMGVKDEHGKICYIIGVLKSIRKQLGKKDGDSIQVKITA